MVEEKQIKAFSEEAQKKVKTLRQAEVKSWFLKFDKEISSFKNKNKCNITSDYIKLYKSKYDNIIEQYVEYGHSTIKPAGVGFLSGNLLGAL